MTEFTMTPPDSLKTWLRLYRLYRKSFPRAERKPFGIILRAWKRGKTDIWCFRDGETFLGFASTMNGRERIMLDYFVVEPGLRGKGIGTLALRQLLERYSDKGFFLEIESIWEDVPNLAERKKRRQFYLNCGLEPLNVMADVFGIQMELLGRNCQLDFPSYHNFYRENYRKMALKHIRPLPLPGEGADKVE